MQDRAKNNMLYMENILIDRNSNGEFRQSRRVAQSPSRKGPKAK